jgi:hypothetical protein
MTEPNVLDYRDDPDRDSTYAAEELAHERFVIEVEGDDPQIDPGDLARFAADALVSAGWSADPLPTFALDVPAASQSGGYVEGSTGIIHLHPLILDRWTILHKLAHYVDPRDKSHGERFRSDYAELVGGVMGDRVRDVLVEAYVDVGL